MAPGATIQPPASISLAPPPAILPLIFATRPSLMARSALCLGIPVPSTMVPPRMTKSYSAMPYPPIYLAAQTVVCISASRAQPETLS